MNVISTVLLALAMSTDAFAAAVVKGAQLHRPHWREALRAGLIFGVIEACTPVIGWWLGSLASSYIEAWDHWIAFGLLFVLGAKMIHSGVSKGEDEAPEDRPTRHGFWMLAMTGFATSIDAMAVGVGLAFIDVSIWPVAASIGFATFVMVTAGMLLGRALGTLIGKRAELLGGLVLIGIGATILYEHLHAAA